MIYIPNHNPKPLSERVLTRMQSGGYETYFKKHPIGVMDKPAYTVTAHYAKGAPDGLVSISDRERGDYMGDFNLTPQQPMNGLTVLELFCGGGLGAVGFKASGFDIVKALDFDKNAVKAYRHNFGDHVEQADISTINIESLPSTDVIFGGPPCQDFSVAGKGAGVDGDRGKLVWRYLDIIEAKKPKAFVFENVKGLLSKRHRSTFDGLLAKFSEIGYEVSWQLINAWDYGVAQKRERVFIVGTRKDLGFKFEFPKPLEGDYRTAVLRDVIGDLPELNNDGYGLRNDEKPYAHKIPDGGNWRSLPEDEQKAFMKGAFYSGGGQTTYLRRMSMDEPGLTITASVLAKATCHLHPKEDKKSPRRFTVRECLRIQSVPDTYVLPDDISLSAKYRIVGNGIASRVAWYIGVALANQLKENA
ncbi:DNA (cytosine-5-)-methyltransferase [Bacillus safensis]|uniref:DNA cytosine methyltransferase n=1 Tax=Bacillus safensis TaxID=561879 RepID=UPI0022824242|nr:DNA (cytosine-5-)-methyltransferase [Bacillus safensis]MCY7711285.1 DNA (cytosine-5-)-methyltransferase [Bacillus safensis]MCY7726455.1 DNA (cytosine-5-)-methyltransferase [Bacillus safensis]MED0883210.1 DNA (cytosine-5-)-methyltransferase [Bacillus safensis]MED0918496.1 DNA (cytosine-5-)-methyltransferase [Bacillus safensis]